MTNGQQKASTGLGKGMILLAWLLFLGLLTLLFNGYLERQHNPNRNLSQAENEASAKSVVLQRNRNGHYVANGFINGKSVVFLVDTGATDVAVPDSLARTLGLTRLAESRSHTANGVVQTWQTRLDQVGLGGIVLQDIRATVLPNMKGKEVLLGMSFLKHLDLIQQGATLTLKRPSI